MKKIFVLLTILYSLSFAQVNWSPTYNLSNTPSATSDYHSVYTDQNAGYYYVCLLYTSDAADERSSVDLGGRRIIKKKTKDIMKKNIEKQ